MRYSRHATLLFSEYEWRFMGRIERTGGTSDPAGDSRYRTPTPLHPSWTDPAVHANLPEALSTEYQARFFR